MNWRPCDSYVQSCDYNLDWPVEEHILSENWKTDEAPNNNAKNSNPLCLVQNDIVYGSISCGLSLHLHKKLTASILPHLFPLFLNNVVIHDPTHTLTHTATPMHGFCMWKVLFHSQPVIFCWLATQWWTEGYSLKNKLAPKVLYTHTHTHSGL